MTKGIDISYYQGDINFDLVRASGIEFVIIREGYRKTTDKKFFEYVKNAKKAGLYILAVYHFSYALNEKESKEEAQFCVSNVKKADLGTDTMIFYDFEYDTVKKAASKGVLLNSPECNIHTLAFCDEVSKLGFIPGIYTNIDYYKNWYTKDVLSRYKIWLADYKGGPDFDCLIQQYSSKGKVPGIKGNVDLNYLFEGPEKPNVTRSIEVVAKEVIEGLWGSGVKRKEALEANGFNYSEVQSKVNEILNGDADKPIIDQSITKKETPYKAKYFSDELVGEYITSANLYCREDAGTNKKALCCIPKGTSVQNYGYYTEFNGVIWLLIQFKLDGILYTGFSSSKYLIK